MNVIDTARRLQQFLETVPLEDYSPFVFDDTEYQIIWLDHADITKEGEVAWFAASTTIEGFDLYILNTLVDAEKKRTLFHEILETQLLRAGAMPPAAHRRALEVERVVLGERAPS